MTQSELNIGGDFAVNFNKKIFASKNDNFYENNCNKKYSYFTDCGRSAITLSLKILKNNKKLKAFLPIYCCPTIIKTFKKNNIKISFYSMGKDLNSPKKLPNNTNDSIFFFIHYFGKKNKKIINYLNLQKSNSKNFYIIEDLAQSCLANLYKNYVGDFVITSLRKFLPVFDGGILYTNYRYKKIIKKRNDNFLSKIILSKTLRNNSKFENLYLNLYSQSEKILDKENEIRAISSISKNIFANLDIKYIQKKRIKNWKILNKSLTNKNIKKLYLKLDKNEVPLAYPIIVNPNTRDRFNLYLKKNKIYCAIHWLLGYKSISKNFNEDFSISKSIISIPIDHRMTNNKLKRMIKIINEF